MVESGFKKGLGRGLSSLLGDSSKEVKKNIRGNPEYKL